MKRSAIVLISLVILVVFAVAVSAQETSEFVKGFQSVWNGVIEFLNVIFKSVLGDSSVVYPEDYSNPGTFTSGEVLFFKVLVMVIVFVLVYAILDRTPVFSDYGFVAVLISLAVSILSTRFLATPGWIETIFLSYSALGIAITVFLPFLIYFFGLYWILGDHAFMRKMGWAVAMAGYLGIFISRYEDIKNSVPDNQFNPIWIYVIAAGLSLIFLMFDKSIRRTMLTAEIKAVGKNNLTELRADISARLDTAKGQLTAFTITPTEYDTIKRNLLKKLKNLDKAYG